MKENGKRNYTYIVKCSDGTLYTGWTNNLEKRLHAHNEGKGAKYTKSRRPVTLVYQESFDTKEDAMRREYAIKQLPRKKKLKLIEGKTEENRGENTERSKGEKEEKEKKTKKERRSL